MWHDRYSINICCLSKRTPTKITHNAMLFALLCLHTFSLNLESIPSSFLPAFNQMNSSLSSKTLLVGIYFAKLKFSSYNHTCRESPPLLYFYTLHINLLFYYYILSYTFVAILLIITNKKLLQGKDYLWLIGNSHEK